MTIFLSPRRWALLGTVLGGGMAGLLAAQPATAQTTAQTTAPAVGTSPGATSPAEAAQPAASAAPSTGIVVGPLKLYGQIEGGIAVNPAKPSDGLNFGQLFTDRANQPTLNQLLLGVEKPIDPKATGFDWGSRFFFMYGSDARYTHFMGVWDRSIDSKYQVDVVEADILLHLPVITSGGVDAHIGLYPTPLGYEVIDPKANPFYTHSFIFNFGLPFKHAGGYGVLHVNDTLDIYGGVDTGTNTTFTTTGDNNGTVAGLAGIGLNNLADGKLTFLALTHFGPENPVMNPAVVGANSRNRVYADAYLTYKATDKLTFTSEGDWVHDAEFNDSAGGFAQYVSYALTDTVTLNGRAEVFTDPSGFFVAGFNGNFSFASTEFGYSADPTGRAFLPVPTNAVVSSGGNTYSELTLGVTWAPSLPPFKTVMLRPEIRWDHAYRSPAFDTLLNRNQVLLSMDAILGF